MLRQDKLLAWHDIFHINGFPSIAKDVEVLPHPPEPLNISHVGTGDAHEDFICLILFFNGVIQDT